MTDRPKAPTPADLAKLREEQAVPLITAKKMLALNYRMEMIAWLRLRGTALEKTDFLLAEYERQLLGRD